MPVESLSYRIDCAAHDAYDGSYTGGLPDPISFLVDDGVLVPDTRLQAIQDAWNDHGGYPDLHTDNMDELRMMWPKLTGLLDALTKEDTVEDK